MSESKTTNYGEENTGMSAALNMSAEGAASPPQTTEYEETK